MPVSGTGAYQVYSSTGYSSRATVVGVPLGCAARLVSLTACTVF